MKAPDKRPNESASRPPRRGRPRSTSTDARILAATLELLHQGGPDAATMDAIAGRAGVARTTIYRRWPNSDTLLVDAMRYALSDRLDQAEEVLEYDRLHGSPLHGAARQILGLLMEPIFRSAFPMMARILLAETALADRFRADVFAPLRALRHRELESRLTRDDGPRGAVDADLLLDMVNGTILYRALMARPLDAAAADSIADLVARIAGLDDPDADGTTRSTTTRRPVSQRSGPGEGAQSLGQAQVLGVVDGDLDQ